jgi:hypothetical protein
LSLLAIPLGLPFDVVLDGYNLSRLTDGEGLLPDVRARGGAVLRFGGGGLAEVRRCSGRGVVHGCRDAVLVSGR